MTGKTHKAGGMLCSIVGYSILRQKGLLLPEVNEGLQWLIIYPFCMWGSIASDLDHHWDSCPQRDYPSWLVNKALHITAPVQKFFDKNFDASKNKRNPIYQISKFFNAKHRSWQTHSDLTLYVILFLMYIVFSGKISFLSAVDSVLLSLVLTGVCMGFMAHLILDILTPEGVWIVEFVILNKLLSLISPRLRLPEKLHIVPHKKLFATGGKWESFIQKVLKVFTILALIWFLVTLFIPDWMSYIPFTIEF